MQKSIITKAVVLAIASMGAGAAFAQSSLQIYGNLDVGYTNVNNKDGNVAGTILPAASFASSKTINGITSSLSSVNALGFKGTEDLGGGYKAGFILEGQMQLDTGAQSGQDGRMWGRQAFVSVTSPFGEVRLGRQYAPMFYTFAGTTVEALGGADIQAVGLVVNNLQVRQDNQVSYWLRLGGFSGALSYSPNAGVASRVSSNRGVTSNTAATGQIIGGATAGAEDTSGRGRSYGLLANYSFPFGLLLSGSWNQNDFKNTPIGPGTSSAFDYFNLDKYTSYILAAKYTIPGVGTQISGQWHESEQETSPFATGGLDVGDIKTRTYSLGVKHPIGNFALGLQYAHTEFTNFTEGSDKAFMFIADYNFSKRTKLYLRAGQMKDDRGNVVRTNGSALTGYGALAGGPFPLLVGLGNLETPFFSGGGVNVDGKTNVIGIGIRHQF